MEHREDAATTEIHCLKQSPPLVPKWQRSPVI